MTAASSVFFSHTDILLACVLVAVAGCGTEIEWEIHQCSADEYRYIERGADVSIMVSPFVSQVLLDDFSLELNAYSDVVSVIKQSEINETILCGVPDKDTEVSSGHDSYLGEATVNGDIIVNTESSDWGYYFESWQNGQDYLAFDDSEIEEIALHGTTDEFHSLLYLAREYYYSPAFVAEVVSHEAAHIALDMRHSTTLHDEGASTTDIIYVIGEATRRAVYWEIWWPEKQRLESLFLSQ